MKKLPFIVLAFISSMAASAQNAPRKISRPDYSSIERETHDQNSIYHYKKLLERYQADDSLLTNLDYRHLYFGTIFTSGYSPYRTSAYADSLKAILKKDALDPNDFDNLIFFEKKVLEDQPFNLRDLNILAYAYHKKGDTSSETKVTRKLTGVLQAILETGDGRTEETAFHVISVAHEYDVLNAMGLKFGGKQSLTKKSCDYLTVQDNTMGYQGVYFDVTQVLKSFSKGFK